MEKDKALQLHRSLEFIGLRAQATSVGLLQLCAELVKANVLDSDAIERIKDAIQLDIVVSNPRGRDRDEFAKTLRRRLDSVFQQAGEVSSPTRIGTALDFEAALLDESEPRAET